MDIIHLYIIYSCGHHTYIICIYVCTHTHTLSLSLPHTQVVYFCVYFVLHGVTLRLFVIGFIVVVQFSFQVFCFYRVTLRFLHTHTYTPHTYTNAHTQNTRTFPGTVGVSEQNHAHTHTHTHTCTHTNTHSNHTQVQYPRALWEPVNQTMDCLSVFLDGTHSQKLNPNLNQTMDCLSVFLDGTHSQKLNPNLNQTMDCLSVFLDGTHFQKFSQQWLHIVM